MNRKSPKVDAFLKKAQKWQREFEQLRAIVLGCGLSEEMKWRFPCYMLDERNIVIIQGFKEYCGLLFFKGALLKDPGGILVKPGEHTQAGRQIRFTGAREIAKMKPVLKAYVLDAIEVEKAGLKVKKASEFALPDELQRRLDETPALKKAFNALTPGRQRAYVLYFSAAKQAKTRASRVEKCVPDILSGKGLND